METNQKIIKIPESNILTVGKLTDYIKQRLENDLQLINIWVKGEISNFTRHNSGHLYFTLKDEISQISCAMFRSSASSLKFEPEHGMKVLVLSSLSVYKLSGKYQLIVSEMHPDGLGALHQKYLQLKEKLEKEGLFSKEHKKNIPKFIKSIELLNKISDIDVIIIGRGGGSLEDLWCFNEEIVARAIFKSKIPTISAVGHETDFTISDFVADCRAPTPSTAAEIAVPDKNELLREITYLQERLSQKTKRTIEFKKQCLVSLVDRPIFKRPLDFINQYLQQIDDLMSKFYRAT